MAKRKTFSLNKDLQDGLSQTMNAVKNYAGEMHYEAIPLNQIELDPENPRDLIVDFDDLHSAPQESDPNFQRKKQEIERLQSLAETINKQGLINPIIVYKHGNKYRLIAGERRCLASTLAGKKDIKANVLSNKPSDFRRSLLQWIENSEREDLNLWERIQNIRQVLAAYQKESHAATVISASLIRNILGCSLPHAMNYHAVLNAPQDILYAMENLSLRNLEKTALIAKVEDAALRKSYLDACIAGASLKQLKTMVQQQRQWQDHIRKTQVKKALVHNRGRKATRINLGMTDNPYVVKVLVDALLKDAKYQPYYTIFAKITWDDQRRVSEAFKELLAIIERNESY